MSHKVFLNGEFLAQEEAKISPMDRGFLFGDGIYEVVPCYDAKPVGLGLHLARMNKGLSEISLIYKAELSEWADIIQTLIGQFESTAVSVYIHISRGCDIKRYHAYPKDIAPTIFAYAFEISPSQSLQIEKTKTYKVVTGEDKRWQRCHIKSTSLLGNVMHFQQGQDAGMDEIILYNEHKMLTEAAACNVFVVKDGLIMTPKLDHQLLPGITRDIALEAMRRDGNFTVSEQDISVETLCTADEVWLTSSSKEIGPVVQVDDRIINDGLPGPLWQKAQTAYNKYKFKL
jgi:D-alanine transaminase